MSTGRFRPGDGAATVLGDRSARAIRRHCAVAPLKTYIAELDELEVFLLRITLALFADHPILVIGDLEHFRDSVKRDFAVHRLGALAQRCTVVVGVTNSVGPQAPDHEMHRPGAPIEKDLPCSLDSHSARRSSVSDAAG